MDRFRYRDRVLYCEDVPVADLAAAYGTPLFVYSAGTLLHHLGEIQKAFAEAEPLICYSIKSNPNIYLARLMREHGSGFDVTSGGELYRALLAGGTGPKIVFAGVGKTDAELRYGLESDVTLFNVESEAELHAARGVVGNPHVKIAGLHMHLGSPILSPEPYRAGAAKAVELIGKLRE